MLNFAPRKMLPDGLHINQLPTGATVIPGYKHPDLIVQGFDTTAVFLVTDNPGHPLVDLRSGRLVKEQHVDATYQLVELNVTFVTG